MSETANWHVAVNGVRTGPLTLAQLVEDVARGDVDARDSVWREGMPDWLLLLEVQEIDDALLAAGVRIAGPEFHDDEPEHNATLRAIIPVGRSGLAIAAGYLGLVSLFLPIVAPIAIIISILAIVHLQKHPEKHGMGRAVFGIIGGVLGIVIGILVVVNMN